MLSNNSKVAQSDTYIPVKTRRVDRPPCSPKRISVLSRSPTMMVRLGSNGCLLPVSPVPNLFKATHFALMQSSITWLGLPALTGTFPPGPSAVRSGAKTAPAPGRRVPPCAGYVESSFVARKRQLGSVLRWMKALDNLVYVMEVSSPQSTAPIVGSGV